MKHTVPIYVANVTVKITEKTGKVSSVNKFILVKDVIVKGFTLSDIARRKQSIADKFVTNSFKQKAKIVNLKLISQHGYGIDD